MFEFTNADNKHIQNALRPPKSFFTDCFKKFPIYIWENKIDKIVSSERTQKGTQIINKRLTKKSRLDFWDRRDFFLWVGVSKRRVEFQMYRVQQCFVNGQEKFNVYLYNFEKYTLNEHVKLHSDNGENYYSGLRVLGQGQGPYSYYWGLQSLDKVFNRFKGNDALKYLDFNKIKAACESSRKIFDLAIMMPHIYKYRGFIEYAQKINARGIHADLVGGCQSVSYYGNVYKHFHSHMGRLTFKFLRTHKNIFKNSDEGFEDYNRRKELEKALGLKVVPEFTKYFRTIEDLKYIPKGVKSLRFQNWVIKNSVKAYEYRDYQNLLEKLGIAFEGDFRIMPKDFNQAHNRAVEAYNNMKDEQKKQNYHKLLEKLLGLEQTIGDYTFILPKELEELKAEGKALKHCVGSYATRVAEGETVILFVRKKRKVDAPLYTLEIKNGKIIQLRGKNNKDANKSAWQASEKLLLFAKSQNIAV